MKRRILKVWQFVLLLAMLMLIPQTMFFCFKRTKFVPIIAACVYGLFGIICSSIFLWGVPGQILSGFKPAENILRFLWKEILSVGMYITFSLCILLLVLS